MCRALAYLGQPVLLDNLLYQPDSALVKQSFMPKMLHLLNLAGFGMRAWDRHGQVDDATWHSYLGAFAHAAGVPEEVLPAFVPALREAWIDVPWSQVIEESAAALHQIVATGVRIVIVSNSDGTVEEVLRELAVCQVGPGPGVRTARTKRASPSVRRPGPRRAPMTVRGP